MSDFERIRQICEQHGPTLGAVLDDYIQQSLDGTGFQPSESRAAELEEALAEALAKAIVSSGLPVLDLLGVALAVKRAVNDPAAEENLQDAVRSAALRHSGLVTAQLYSVAPAGAA